jgi:hypothetical protein
MLADLIPWRFRSRHNFVKARANYFFRPVLRTPPAACQPGSDVAMHILVCQRDLHMCLLAAKSFLRFVPHVALLVHDDGSLDASAFQLLQKHLPGARVISRAEADRALDGLLPPDIAAARQTHVLLMKVLDFNHFSDGRRTLLLDSDIVFRSPPDEAMAWIGGDDREAIYNPDPMRDTYRAPVRPSAPLPDWFNSGFLGYRVPFTLAQMVAALRTMNYVLEDQTAYAYLLAGMPSRALDQRRYHVYQGGEIPDDARMVHFISPDRFTGEAYIALCRQVCAELTA